MIDSRIMRELASAIADAGSTVVHSSEHTATVTRVDLDGTVWVTIPGGADETPASTSLVSVSQGDTVKVLIANGRATVTGNATSPAANVTELSVVEQKADTALSDADVARIAAEEATLHASIANEAAVSAQADATAAGISAESASTSATNALLQLAVVQDVAGVLAWIQSHGRYALTQDTTIQPDKVYFESVQGKFVPVTNPVAADLSSYYELILEKSTADYVMAHLAVTSEGLWVLPAVGTYDYVETTDTSVVTGKTYYRRPLVPSQDHLPSSEPEPGEEDVPVPSFVADKRYFAPVLYTKDEQDNITEELTLLVMPGDVVYDDPADSNWCEYDEDGGFIAAMPASYLSLNPSRYGFYEYVATGSGYKMLLSNDSKSVYDANGNLVTRAGESIELSSSRPQHIGGDDAYILYYDSDDDGMPDSIAIGGENVTIGSKSLSGMIADIDQQQDSVDELGSFVRVDADGASPYMSLGGAGAYVETRMTDSGVGYYTASSTDPIATITKDQNTGHGVLGVDNVVVNSGIKLGDWEWTPRKNGNFALKWCGALPQVAAQP